MARLTLQLCGAVLGLLAFAPLGPLAKWHDPHLAGWVFVFAGALLAGQHKDQPHD